VAWYDVSQAPAMARWDGNGSAYAFLRSHCGLELASAEQSIEAVLSQPEDSEAFGFQTPSPCLLLKRKTLSTTGRAVEYVEGTFRGDAYAYRLTLRA
jgi:GntR family transcriptional regulator